MALRWISYNGGQMAFGKSGTFRLSETSLSIRDTHGRLMLRIPMERPLFFESAKEAKEYAENYEQGAL